MKNKSLIFTSGKQHDYEYSVADLQSIADGYSELKYSSPWVFGHEPETGSPAAGWVRSLEVETGEDGVARLYANSDFNKIGEEAIKNGSYENKSISLYTPESKFNPNPGSWSIRHVALLGAEPPALKNLGPVMEGVEYSEDDTEFVTYDCACGAKPSTPITPKQITFEETDMNAVKEIKKMDSAEINMAAEMTDKEKIAALEAELEALKFAQVEEIKEEITEEQDEADDSMSEVEALKVKLAELTAELNDVKEANTALSISSSVTPYYSEGLLTEEILPESTLTRVVTKLTLGLTNYSETETPLAVIEALLTALNSNAPEVSYGETWSEAPKETVAKSVSYSNGDEMHDLAVATATKYSLSYGKALSAIVKSKEISDAKSVDFGETLTSMFQK